MPRAKVRVCLVGATGLVGGAFIAAGVRDETMRIVAVARRTFSLPGDGGMDLLVGEPSAWPELIRAARADVLVCALGTTIRRAGSQPAFRAIDHDLVLQVGQAARDAGIARMISVSSVAADSASRNFYLATKGETEADLGRLGFRRMDLLRPGLLIGRREESRPLEGIAQIGAPVLDLLALHGSLRRYRSIRASTVARAMLLLVRERADGRFVHEYDSIVRHARRTSEQ